MPPRSRLPDDDEAWKVRVEHEIILPPDADGETMRWGKLAFNNASRSSQLPRNSYIYGPVAMIELLHVLMSEYVGRSDAQANEPTNQTSSIRFRRPAGRVFSHGEFIQAEQVEPRPENESPYYVYSAAASVSQDTPVEAVPSADF